MADRLALGVIVLAGAYLLWLAGLCLVAPARATRFLDGFASSAPAHYFELAVRLLIGAALLRYAPRMLHAELFHLVGWVLIASTILLLAIPWHWHRAIARRAVPYATAHLRLFGLSSAAMGGFVLVAALRGAG